MEDEPKGNQPIQPIEATEATEATEAIECKPNNFNQHSLDSAEIKRLIGELRSCHIAYVRQEQSMMKLKVQNSEQSLLIEDLHRQIKAQEPSIRAMTDIISVLSKVS